MAVFRVRVKKQHSTKLITWENRYYMSGDDLSSVHAKAFDLLIPCEQAIHQATVNIIGLVTSDLPVGGDFISTPVSAACLNGVSGDELPGILTLNITFDVEGFGLPDRKYYHVFWGETGQAGGVWGTTETDNVEDAFQTLFDSLEGTGVAMCDLDGNAWNTARTIGEVGHHKFSKRSKRAVAGP
jgi:hypothetical protein